MALRHKSAIKQHRRSLRRRAINQRNKSLMKTYIKKVRAAIEEGKREEALQLLPRTFKAIDKTVAKGAIHKNTGSRYKSRLTRLIQAMAAQAN
ncbi:MAG: 30S ribosomal protein S20 [Candidatus Saccharicenans sp.]|nr:MAG: 30S ribosomal protein S20 [Candidatus Aminicenantes bacterium]HEK85029.1 30S ribosomal protein S20 [Candidatus Aminicenantes bacterium]